VAKPRETGGNVPAAKPKKVRKVVVKVAPEATRPVTPTQRKAIDRGVEQARKNVFAQKVATNVARSQKVDRLQREAADLNAGRKKVTLADRDHGLAVMTTLGKKKFPIHLRERKVIVKNGKLYLHTGAILGLGGSDLPLAGAKTGTYSASAGVDAATKKITAPAVKILSLTAKPGQAIGKQVEKATGSKAAGFVGSIALDPTTYLTFGRSKVATTLAQRAGERAYKDAVKAGADHAAATKAATKVADKVEHTAPQNKGIQVKAFGKSTSGRTTAYVSRKTGLSKAATKVRESKVVQGLGQDLRPDFRPKGVSEAEHQAIRGASREARAQTTRGRVEAISKAQALKKALKPEEHAKVVSAIERGTVYNLPEHLRAPAREVELAFRKARRAEVKAGIKVGNRRQYFTHAIDEQADEGGKKVTRGGGKRVIRPVYGKARQHEGTIEQIKAKGGPEFSTNVPSVVAGRLSKSAGDVAQAKMNRALAAAGRKVNYGEKVDLADGEALYKIHGSDLQHLSRWEEEHVVAGTKKPPKKGSVQYVVLNEKAVDNAVKSVNPGASRSSIGRGYDKVQGGFKFVATVPNPGFHARNLYGDTFNAYLGQSTAGLARNLGHSARGLRALGKQEEAARTLGAKVKPTGKGITVRGKYGGKEFLTYDQLAKEAVNSGAIRSGFISREIPELLRDTSKAASSREFGRHLKRVVQNREDLIRLATYIGARKRGLTAREASDWAAQHHFDYGDLTEFERGTLRRLLPFYTFSARNIPLQAKKLLTNPGKYANLEKIREDLAGQAGLPDDWQSHIPEYQQRGIPFPVVVGGKALLVSPSLPIADLNQLALPHVTSDDFSSSLTEQGKKFLSMLNPVIKDPVELYANYNSFFRSQIQNPESPLVAAPSYVSTWPASIRRKFGIVPDYVDKRTGKKTWGWPAKLDYVAKAIPGPTNAVQQLLSSTNRRGQGETGKLVSYFTGLKPDPYDPTTTAINNGYALLDKLNQHAATLRQRGQGLRDGKHATAEYKRVNQQIKDITAMIDSLKRKRGDKMPKRKVKPTGNLISASSGPSVSDILGHDAPTLNDILGP
jgi:hypothetical protein